MTKEEKKDVIYFFRRYFLLLSGNLITTKDKLKQAQEELDSTKKLLQAALCGLEEFEQDLEKEKQ